MLAAERRAYPLAIPEPGRVELDPELVWEAAGGVIAGLARRARRLGLRVGAIALAVSGDEAVFLDAANQPVGPCIMALDTRSADTARRWARAAGRGRIHSITGLPVHPAHTLVRLLWLRRHEPERFRRVARVLCWTEYLALRMGLPPVSEPSVAARTMAWDITSETWSAELLGRARLPASWFPEVRPAGTIVGELPARTAGRLSLDGRVSLVSGGLDQAVATLGAGVTRAGEAMIGTGSWEALVVLADSWPPQPRRLWQSGIAIGPFAVAGRLAAMATQVGGGSLVRWLRDVLAPGVPVGRLLRTAPDRPTDILVMPHLEGSYSPWLDPHSRAAVTGLSLTTGRGTLVRAVLEGISYELRLNLERMESAGLAVGEIRCTGGGARSAAWVQLKADVLDRPMVVVDVAENGAFGAACLAGAAIGLFPSADSAARDLVRPVRTFEPRPAMAARYERSFARYRGLYPALRTLRAAAQVEGAAPVSSRTRPS